MTRRSGVLTVVISTFVLALLIACGGNTHPIVGEWQAANPSITFKFFQDGTVTVKQDGRTFTGQYKLLDSENIRIDMQGDLGQQSFVLENFKIAGDVLTAKLNGQQIVFGRTSTSSSPSSSAAQSDLNSTKVLIGKWKLESDQNPSYIYEFKLETDGTIRLVVMSADGSNATDNGEVDVQPAGGGKFTGYFVTNGQGNQRLALEFDVLDNGQRIIMKQESGVNGEWHTGTLARVDDTK